MHNRKYEEDTSHVLCCLYHLFSLHRNKIVSTLQLKVLELLEMNIFPLYFLKWMLDDNEDNIEEVLDYAMTALNLIGRKNI